MVGRKCSAFDVEFSFSTPFLAENSRRHFVLRLFLTDWRHLFVFRFTNYICSQLQMDRKRQIKVDGESVVLLAALSSMIVSDWSELSYRFSYEVVPINIGLL